MTDQILQIVDALAADGTDGASVLQAELLYQAERLEQRMVGSVGVALPLSAHDALQRLAQYEERRRLANRQSICISPFKS